MGKKQTPKSEQEISEIIKSANSTHTPIRIEGGGTRAGLGHGVAASQVLCLEQHKGISLYEPEALTIVANSGTRLTDLQKELAKQGQQLPFEPMDHRALYGTKGNSTIGGVVACNISGSRRVQAGACRDSLIGIRFVNGEGEIVKNGGRVMKNVTGLDLVKLLCGSHGTLGVISEVAFKVLPLPERQATLAIPGLGVEGAISTLSKALATPFDITGAAFVPDHGENGLTLMRVEGFYEQVDYRLNRLRDRVAASADVEIIENEAHDRLWREVRDVVQFAGRHDPVWRISARPGDGPAICKAIQERYDAEFVFDWGGGLIWIMLKNCRAEDNANFRNIVRSFSGHAMLVRAPEAVSGNVKIFQPQGKTIAKISEAIRGKFDPGGILNPGRMDGVKLP